LRISASLTVAVLFAGACPLLQAAEVAAPPDQLAVTSMAMDGTNLLLTASVPPGLQTVSLDTRPTLDTPWQQVGQTNAPADGGELTFVFPQSIETSRFFRLRGNTTAPAPPLVSAELEFVATTSLSSHISKGNAVFHFKGRVDGSDKILITRDGALWDHVNWNYPPQAVSINDTRWNPAEKNYMSVAGPEKFLPQSFSLESAELEVIKGRDVVALERTRNGLVVYINDTPVNSGEYEFNVIFHPFGPNLVAFIQVPASGLKIAARIDGSDCIKITADKAVLEHKTFGFPVNLTVNGIPWNARQSSTLQNDGPTRFLPGGIDFSTARIISRKGRDLATAWGTKDTLWVRFADNPNGSDDYEIEIAFGSETPPQ
jgi:hypothetical protein